MGKKKNKFDLSKEFKQRNLIEKIELLLNSVEKMLMAGYWGDVSDVCYIITNYGIEITSESNGAIQFLDEEYLDILFEAEVIINKNKIKNEFST
jgi:hypothetical protein